MSRRSTAFAIAALAVLLLAGCRAFESEAMREYLVSLELSKTGGPLEEQLLHADRAVRLEPDSATFLEHRADLLFGLGRLRDALADYKSAVELADRPYLRFERADVECAMDDLDSAVADLDSAIARQPENTQFYPRRALALVAAGRIREARADVDHAMALTRGGAAEPYARGALHLVEGKPAEAVADLDFAVTTWPDSSHAVLPRTVRLLALTALRETDRAAAEFDEPSLLAAERWPKLGYRYWLTARGCQNAFIPRRLAALADEAALAVERKRLLLPQRVLCLPRGLPQSAAGGIEQDQ